MVRSSLGDSCCSISFLFEEDTSACGWENGTETFLWVGFLSRVESCKKEATVE